MQVQSKQKPEEEVITGEKGCEQGVSWLISSGRRSCRKWKQELDLQNGKRTRILAAEESLRYPVLKAQRSLPVPELYSNTQQA